MSNLPPSVLGEVVNFYLGFKVLHLGYILLLLFFGLLLDRRLDWYFDSILHAW